jgi:3-deoxy-D-manno-octulosonic-acid transferase
VAVIGKSFFAKGGQNPTEAILAGVPVICGLHMDNFEPLVSELQRAGGIWMVENRAELISAIQGLLTDSKDQVSAAKKVLERHQGAIKRTIDLFSLAEDL